MAAIKAYFDDSGDHASLTLAGYVGTLAAWEIFEPNWQSALDQHGIPYFHMKEIPAPKSPMHKFFGKENEPKLTALLTDLSKVLAKSWIWKQFRGVGCVVPFGAIDKFNRSHGRAIDPLALAIYTCSGLIHDEFPGQTVEALLDRLTKPHRSIGLAEEYAATNPRPEMRNDNVMVIPAKGDISSRTVRPLQAADFAAYEGQKKYHRLDPFFKDVDLSDATTSMDVWYEYENWLELNNRPSPDERKSLTALSDATEMRFPIWLYEVLRAEDDLRGGRWVS